MNLTESQMQQILNDSMPDIVSGIKTDLASKLKSQIGYSIDDVIGKFVRDWVKENIIPEIESSLIESKEGLISIGVKMANTIVEELAKAQVATIKERLEKQWDRKKIFEALLG